MLYETIKDIFISRVHFGINIIVLLLIRKILVRAVNYEKILIFNLTEITINL